jgi:hypothetical protein
MMTRAADLVPRVYHSLLNDGMPPKEARRVIQSKIDLSDRTIRRALPQEAKREYKLDKMSKLPNNQAKLADVTPVNIPPPEQTIIEPEQEKELVHRTIRITMSARKLLALSKHMAQKVKEEGMETNYAIEYDYVDKELYIDVTEEWETKLMVND